VREHGRLEEHAVALAPNSILAPPATASAIQRSTRSAASSPIIGPTSVCSSSTSPTLTAEPARKGVEKRRINGFVDVNPLCRDARLAGVGKAATAQRAAGHGRSASGSTITAAFAPPAQANTRFVPALARMAQPALALP